MKDLTEAQNELMNEALGIKPPAPLSAPADGYSRPSEAEIPARSRLAGGSAELLDTIIHGDCMNIMPGMDCESVALVVTSPPYFNAREYSNWNTYAEYLDWCAAWICQCVRVLQPGRMLCINSSAVIESRASRGERSRRYNIPADLWAICKVLGSWFAEELIWEKPEGAAINRNQRFHLDRHPMQWRANATTERVLVCQKPTTKLNDAIIRGQDTAYRLDGEYDRGEVWRMNPEQRYEHPAAYPLELPAKLIRYYSWPGEIVLDPFCGSGTTCRAAKDQHRRYIGIEQNGAYCRMANNRLSQDVLNLFSEGAEPAGALRSTGTQAPELPAGNNTAISESNEKV